MDLVEIRKKALKEKHLVEDTLADDQQGTVLSGLADPEDDKSSFSYKSESLADTVGNHELIIDDYPQLEDDIDETHTSLSDTTDSDAEKDQLLSSQDDFLIDIDNDAMIDLHSDPIEENIPFEIIPELEVTTDDVLISSVSQIDSDIPPKYSDPLEALFASSSSELELATDENYFDGLLGSERVNDDTKQLLSFMLSDEEYAVGISSVREIIKVKDVTEIPRVPSYILGLLSLRGVIIPVFDLNQRLNLGTTDIGNQSRIVVCQQGDQYAGFLVDRINQVVKISEDKIEAAPSILSTLDRDFVQGIGRLQGRMIILLDLEIVMAISH